MRSSSLIFVLPISLMIVAPAFIVNMAKKSIESSCFPPGWKDDLQKNGLEGNAEDMIPFVAQEKSDSLKIDGIVASDLENVKEDQQLVNGDKNIEDLMRIPILDDFIDFTTPLMQIALVFVIILFVVFLLPKSFYD